MTASSSPPVVIVGAGLSGLNCARELAAAGVPVRVLEAADGIGGRVRTDEVDGFRLDRGFQVFFTAYPAARRVLDYDRLRLRAFTPGALVRANGAFHRVVDPVRAPAGALASLLAPVGTLGDKLRVLSLRRRALATPVAEMFEAPERTIREELHALGFSERMVTRFFRPFLGGIFLDPELGTTSRMLYFVYRMLSEGDTTLPEGGMGRIPEQLAARLPPGSVHLNARVTALRREGDRVTGVTLADGTALPARAVVVATNVADAAGLTGATRTPAPRGVSCVYFATRRAPVVEPLLVLDGESRGPVLNLCVPSVVAAGYAPEGWHLVSATVVGAAPQAGGAALPAPGATGDAELEQAIRAQMSEWFGAAAVAEWRALRTYRIPWALFDQSPGTLEPAERPVCHGPGLFVCGDHVENASINGAMHAGARAGAAVLAEAPVQPVGAR
jgi:phytoene dehydrogenase-like protein